MIIDLISDRKDSNIYDAYTFYNDIFNYYQIDKNIYCENILNALDNGTNEDVQKALCDYIKNNEYNLTLCDYINSVEWI